MAFTTESNRHAVGAAPEQITTGIAGPEIGVVGRIFIDLGIAVAAIGGAFFTGGTSLTLLGAEVATSTVVEVGASVTALVTNTAIDVQEGHTDALTLGLDIGLPFATEVGGALLSAGLREVTLPERFFNYLSKGEILAKSEGVGGARTTYNTLIKNMGEKVEWQKGIQSLVKDPATNITMDAEGIAIWNNQLKDLEKLGATLDAGFRSITDILDKVTGATRELLARLLPRLAKAIKYIKKAIAQFRKAVSAVLNPVNLAKTQVETRVRAVLKNIKPDELDLKLKMKTIYQRYQVRKQSIMQNALISKYNIQRVSSSWVLGTSLVINDTESDGTIKDAHLIWWFIPEFTKHNGEKGATPEPMGKRPVGMLNINQAQYDAIMAEASKGRFYLDNVSGGKSPTTLYGSGGGLTDLSDNFINKLFKNALSVIPGYSLFTSVKMSIGQFQKLTDSIVSGQYGTSVMKDLTNYKKYLHEYGTKLLPSQYKSEMIGVYNNGTFDGSTNLLKSVESRATSKMGNISKDGRIIKVKNY